MKWKIVIASLAVNTQIVLAQDQVGAVEYAPELFSPKLSGSVCGFSQDGKTIYFVREDTIARQLHLFQAARDGAHWKNSKLLPFSGKSNDYGGRFTRDGKVFYFTSDRPAGSNKEDDNWNIWKTQRHGASWTEPTPLKNINDRGLECCPLPLPGGELMFSADRADDLAWWISVVEPSANSETVVDSLNYEKAWQWPSSLNKRGDILFLNSMKRPDSKGMDDIYVSFLQHDGRWSSPKNLGPTVNTEEYEDGAILTPDEQWLIFCRHKTGATPSRVMVVKWKPVLDALRLRP